MYIKRILRVPIPGVTMSMSDSCIFVSFVSRVPVSGDLGYKPTRHYLDRSWSCPKSSGHIKKNFEKIFFEQ